MIKAVLFDLDGTFADTAPDLGSALNKCLVDQKQAPLSLEEIRLETSNGANALIKLGFHIEEEHPNFSTLRESLLEYYSNNIAEHTRPFEGMEELISSLLQNDRLWGVVTNKPERFTVPLMEKLALAQSASCIVSGDTTAHSKPHPESLLYAAKLIDVPPHKCLYVGDAERDIQAARNAGMPSLIALFGYIGPNDQVESWGAEGMVQHPLEILDFI